MNYLRLIPLIGLLFLASCEEETECNCEPEDGAIKLSVSPRWGDQGFEFGAPLTNISGYDVYVQQLKFYLSDIRATKDNGEVVELSDIEFYDLREQQDEYIFTAPSGDYTSISFGIGVPVTMNGTEDPDFETGIYDSDHPLSVTNGMYWDWQDGYIFMTFQGRYDTLGTGNPDDLADYSNYAIHTGRDTCYREVTIGSGFGINEDMVEFNVIMDAEKFFYAAGDTIDLNEEDTFHGSLDNIETGIRFSNNISESLSGQVE